MPAIGRPSAAPGSVASPTTSEDDRIAGIIDRGIRHTSSSSSDQSRVRRSISRVRLALVTSVTWMPPRRPPVRFHTTQVSGVPKSSSPASAAARAPGTWSRIHAILEAEKYVASGSPVSSVNRSARPSAARGELVDARLGARVLPDQRVVDRAPGAPIPHHRRLALVGDPDAGDVTRREMRLPQRGGGHPLDVRPDLDRVVLDPAGVLHDLLVLALRDRDDRAR